MKSLFLSCFFAIVSAECNFNVDKMYFNNFYGNGLGADNVKVTKSGSKIKIQLTTATAILAQIPTDGNAHTDNKLRCDLSQIYFLHKNSLIGIRTYQNDQDAAKFVNL